MSVIKYEKELTQTFNDIVYHVRALCHNQVLYLEIEHKENGLKWKNEFSDKCTSEICILLALIDDGKELTLCFYLYLVLVRY